MVEEVFKYLTQVKVETQQCENTQQVQNPTSVKVKYCQLKVKVKLSLCNIHPVTDLLLEYLSVDY